MLSIESARNIISLEFEKIVFPDEPKDLYDPLRYILAAGGKRIRPVMVLLACDLFEVDFMKALYPAMGIEIFHNFTLLHDDLMDNSPVRRKNPTVHTKWNSNIAILSGDAMSIIASQYVARADASLLPKVLPLFNDTALKVCEGQMMDMNFEQAEYVSMNDYLQMISLKTSVLIAASAKMGALVAKAPEKDCNLIYDFGYTVGLAFQIQDDLLDVYGDEESFGKRIGNDIVTNKKTFLLIKALELSSGNNLIHLRALLSNPDIGENEKIKSVKIIFDRLDIRSISEVQIDNLFKKALSFLDLVNVPFERKRILKEYAEDLLIRKF